MDFRNKDVVVSEFDTVENNFREFLEYRNCGDPIKVQQKLNVAGVFIYQCYELSMKYYLFHRYNELVEQNILSQEECDDRQNTLTKPQANRKYLYQEMERYANPTTTASGINFTVIKQNSNLISNKKKHEGCLVNEVAFQQAYKEIKKFVLTYVDDNLPRVIDEQIDYVYSELAKKCNYWTCENRWGYALVCDGHDELSYDEKSALLSIPWSIIFDFDESSEKNGLCSSYISKKSYQPDRFQINNPSETEFNPMVQGPYWYFLGGISDDSSSYVRNSRDWRQKQKRFLAEALKRYHEVFSRPLHVLVIGGQVERLQDLICDLDTIYEENISYYILSKETKYEELTKKLSEEDPAIIMQLNPINVKEFVLCIKKYTNLISDTTEKGTYHLCGAREKVSIVPQEYSHLDLPYLEVYKEQKNNIHTNLPDDFYKGKEMLSWYGAREEFALRRPNIEREICKNILRYRDEVSSKILQLRHLPGAGGTTLSLQVAQWLSSQIPVAYIKYYEEEKTSIQVQKLYHCTQTSLLLIADENKMSLDQVRRFCAEMKARTIPHIILYVARLQKNNRLYGYGYETLIMLMELSNDEIDELSEKLLPYGLTLDTVENIKKSNCDRYPFYMSLYTFEEGFQGIKDYIERFWKNMSSEERRAITFISLVDKYSHRSIEENFFPHKKIINSNDIGIFDDPVNENLIYIKNEGNRRYYRIRHPRFADEILLLALGEPKGIQYAEKLSTCLCDLIDYSRVNSIYVRYDSTIEMLTNLLILRDIGNVGIEEKFSDVIIEIKNSLEKNENYSLYVGRVFKKLVEQYPDEPHFMGHLSRFYTNIEHDYERGVATATEALKISEKQNKKDPILYHICGISIKNKLKYGDYPKLERYDGTKKEEYIENIKENMMIAGDYFQEVRNSPSKKLAGYISHIEMCIDFLDAMKRIHGMNSTYEFIEKHKNSWMMNFYDLAVTLLYEYKELPVNDDDDFSRARLKDRASFLLDAEKLMENLEDTIEMWEEYLQEAEVRERVMIRRFIVYAKKRRLEARGEQDQREIKNIIDLMEQNIAEDPKAEVNISLWFQAMRKYREKKPEIVLDEALAKLALWKQLGSNNIMAYYYYYVLTCIKAIEGSSRAEAEIPRLTEELSSRASKLSNNKTVQEWLGQGQGLMRLLPAYKYENNHRKRISMDEIASRLQILQGRLSSYKRDRNAKIRAYNMDVFFVPKDQEKINQVSQDDVSKQVLFSCGFSYYGVRAYDKSVKLRSEGDSELEKHNVPQVGKYERVKILSWDSLHKFIKVNLENYTKISGIIYKESIEGQEKKLKLEKGAIIYAYVKSFVEGKMYCEMVLSELELNDMSIELNKWKNRINADN